jgi:hypothetical protein
MAKRTGGFIGQDGINAPDPATGVTGTAGNEQVTVSWTAPSDVGGAAITGYNVQSSNGDGTYLSFYNIASASYSGNSLTVASSEGRPVCVAISSDGTKLYVSGQIGDAIDQYTLSTPYDVSSGTYDSVTFSYAASAGTNVQGMFFKPDGTKFFLTDDQNNRVYAYSMSTAWDLLTASYDSVNFNVSSQSTNTNGVVFNSDGSKFFIVGSVSTAATVYQYNMSTNWLVSSASYSNKSLNVSSQTGTGASGIQINSDDDSLFLASSTTDTIYEYQMSTANDLATASFANSYSTATETSALFSIYFGDSGTKLYACSYSDATIYQYSTGLAGYPTSSPVTVTGLTNGTSYTFNVWAINPFGWATASDASGSVSPLAAIAVIALGQGSGGNQQGIDTFNIGTTGNATDFGDLSTLRVNMGSAGGSNTRGMWAGGTDAGTKFDRIDYVTIQTAGNAADFGNLAAGNSSCSSLSNSTRYITGGGTEPSTTNRIQYVTINTLGNTTDFGDLTSAKAEFFSTANSTRGLWFAEGSGGSDDIEYVTIASTGNATDFGNMTVSCESAAALASSTRALHGGGSGDINNIGYVTIASTGNAIDFGDLTVGRTRIDGTSSSTRGVFAGGYSSGVIDYVIIASTGNATDFGDMTVNTQFTSATSSAHGGLQ